MRLPGESTLPTTFPRRALDASTAAGASSRDETQGGLGAWVCLKGPQDVTAAFTKPSVTFASRHSLENRFTGVIAEERSKYNVRTI